MRQNSSGTSLSKYPFILPLANIWVAVVVAVKINDIQLAVPADHHITDVVVAVLISLWPAFKQIKALVYVVDKRLPVFIFQRALGIFVYFVIHFTVEANLPIFLSFRGRYGMDLFEYPPSFQAIYILFGI